MIFSNLKTPYYAVIFTTLLTDDIAGYFETAVKMELLATKQKGFLGIESARSEINVTVSYWNSLDAITQWKHNIEHTEVSNRAREQWYQQYQLRICKVERDYDFKK